MDRESEVLAFRINKEGFEVIEHILIHEVRGAETVPYPHFYTQFLQKLPDQCFLRSLTPPVLSADKLPERVRDLSHASFRDKHFPVLNDHAAGGYPFIHDLHSITQEGMRK